MSDKVSNTLTALKWQDFVATSPPGREYTVEGAVTKIFQNAIQLNSDDVYEYCENENCKGFRFFNLIQPINNHQAGMLYNLEYPVIQIVYRCKNCNTNQRCYVFQFLKIDVDTSILLKIAQYSVFGSPIPSRAISLIGADRELFLKGRRAENQGMGIAAFAYYRRIIENQWKRFLDQIIKVGRKTGVDPTTIGIIEAAQKERQFDKAVRSMGDAVPSVLRLNGQNPISLLYSALSEGLHEKSDEDCLELAGYIRIIIYELAERLNSALQEHNELDAAVKRLASRNNQPATPSDEI